MAFTAEINSPISADRMFKAAIVDGHNLGPKLMPGIVASASIEGDGGVGSVKHLIFTEAFPFTHVKERVDLLDNDKLEYKYTVIEGADIGKKLETAAYHVKVETAGNGCVVKVSCEYKTLGGVDYTEDEKKMKDGIVGVYKAVEGYLVANPDAYA